MYLESNELMSVQIDNRIIEIGFGTGKLIYRMAQQIDKGLIDGVDFSNVSIGTRKKGKLIFHCVVTIK